MDKGWMHSPRYSDEYQNGLKKFMEFAFCKSARDNTILCPCKKCVNQYWLEKNIVQDHLTCDGFVPGYTTWIYHGEDWCSPSIPTVTPEIEIETDRDDEIDPMLREGLGIFDANIDVSYSDGEENEDVDAETYYKLATEASQELYPDCHKFSRLQFVVRLLNIKNLWNMSNACFDELLLLLKEALPKGENLPKNYHGARKFLRDVGLGYENVDACINDCVLYRKEHAKAVTCPTCKASRWKSEKVSIDGKRVHRVPVKVVRHFPLKRRLQRLFMSSKTAASQRWHSEGRTKDGLLRHPADSTAWKNFDFSFPEFSAEPRNIRLALATDGFSPFRTLSVSHSTWPVILIPYNVPPWECMKQSNFILSILIPGPISPGNDIDVYLQLVIDDLLEFWHKGVRTYDVSRAEWFQLRAALFWTISDYPGHAYLSGRKTNGEVGCANCYLGTCSLYLKHGHKTCYMGHRRFLPHNHKLRFDAHSFDGTQELREAPIPLSGYDASNQTKDLHIIFGKAVGKDPLKKKGSKDKSTKPKDLPAVFGKTVAKEHRKKKGSKDKSTESKRKKPCENKGSKDKSTEPKWKKRSCFFQLPYWETLLAVGGKENEIVSPRNQIVSSKIQNVQQRKQAVGGKENEIVSPRNEIVSSKFQNVQPRKQQAVGGKENEIVSPRNEIVSSKFQNVQPRKQQAVGGKEVALCSLGGSKLVAYGRLQRIDKAAICIDKLPLGEYYEVLVDIVLDNNVLLPRPQDKVTKLGGAFGLCIPWPLRNVMERDGSPLNLAKRSQDLSKRM